jgi:uncharacterized membrane protein
MTVQNGGATQNQIVAAVTYLLGFVTGIVFLYLEPYDKDEFVRFHARQSIAFCAAVIAVNIVFGVFLAILPVSIGRIIGGLEDLINLGFAIVWLFLMWKAFTGQRYRLPYLADIADSFTTAP